MTTKEKIKKYLDNKGISKNKFYTTVGLSSTFLDSGKTIGVDKLKIIIEKYPDINIEWLVMDKGPMVVDMDYTHVEDKEDSTDDSRLWGIINSQIRQLDSQSRQLESQQRQLEIQAHSIEILSQRVPAVAPGTVVKMAAGE